MTNIQSLSHVICFFESHFWWMINLFCIFCLFQQLRLQADEKELSGLELYLGETHEVAAVQRNQRKSENKSLSRLVLVQITSDESI